MRHIVTLFVLLFAGTAAADDARTIEDIIARHTEARGGAGVIEAVQSVRVALEITEPGFTVTGDYVATREGFMRIDIYADGTRVFTEALGPDGGWQMMADGSVKGLTPEGLDALRRGLEGNLYGLHERAALGYRYRLVGKTEQGGRPVYELEEVASDGFSKHLFVDAETYQVIADVRTAALHPDVDSTEKRQMTFYSVFEAAAGGPLYSTVSQTRDMDTGENMQRVRITARTLNPEIDPAVFKRPEAGAGE